MRIQLKTHEDQILDFEVGQRCVRKTTIEGIYTDDPHAEAHPIDKLEGYLVMVAPESDGERINRGYTINRFFSTEQGALRFLNKLEGDCTHLELYTQKQGY